MLTVLQCKVNMSEMLNFKMRKRKYVPYSSAALLLFILFNVSALVQGDIQKAETQVPGIVQPKSGKLIPVRGIFYLGDWVLIFIWTSNYLRLLRAPAATNAQSGIQIVESSSLT